MEFFDKKQDVLDIQLTSYGKQKFSEGDFNPSHYVFYDDGILYDGLYAPISESQSDIINRVQSTPRLKAQTFFTSSTVSENYIPHDINYNFNNLTTANAKYFRALGRNDPWSNYVPAWNINNVLDSKGFLGPASYKGELAIPTFSSALTSSYNSFTPEGQQGIVYTVKSIDRLLLDVREINAVLKGRGNFDIEIFEVSEDGQSKLQQLSFINEGPDAANLVRQTKPYEVVGTLRGTNEETRGEFPILDPSYVEYSLSIRVDDEIVDVPSRPGSQLYQTGYDSPPEPDVCEDVAFPEVD
tara:strand:+ start:1366 stop:2259 length:894 start_codon:yes stop_codon:yes gene_type:complete